MHDAPPGFRLAAVGRQVGPEPKGTIPRSLAQIISLLIAAEKRTETRSECPAGPSEEWTVLGLNDHVRVRLGIP